MTLGIELYTPDHLRALTLRDRDAQDVTALGLPALDVLYRLGPAITLRDPDGQVMACAGLVFSWPGNAEAWALLSPRAASHRMAFGRAMRRMMARAIETFQIRRIQAHVDDGFQLGHRFARFMGFRKEAILEQYGLRGETCALYAWVQPKEITR